MFSIVDECIFKYLGLKGLTLDCMKYGVDEEAEAKTRCLLGKHAGFWIKEVSNLDQLIFS